MELYIPVSSETLGREVSLVRIEVPKVKFLWFSSELVFSRLGAVARTAAGRLWGALNLQSVI
jgi:hypothetical protein